MKLGIVLLGAFLVAGFYAILEKRFGEGGIYPHYASFRSDPLGTSVLYESLESHGHLRLSRNVTDLDAIQGLDGDSALLLLGYPRDGFEDIRASDRSPVMKAVEQGARLVVTINPGLVPEVFRPGLDELEEDWIDRRRRVREERSRREAREAEPAGNGEEDAEANAEEGGKGKASEDGAGSKPASRKTKESDAEKEERRLEEEMEAAMGPRLTAKLGFEVENPSAFERPEEGWETTPGETCAAGGVPRELPMWRSQYRFRTKDASWRAVVRVEGNPVVIERPWGKGTVVLASDTYFASNESLHLGAEPGFLLWLLGGKTKIVFDETIHGTVESGGAMKLIRRYRAHGFFLGLVAFLLLWAWRSASPLVPGSEALDRGLVGGPGAVMGEETGLGLVRLLRRSVPTQALLVRCVEIWGASAAAEVPEKAKAAIVAIVARHRSDPRRFGVAEAYRNISDLLRKR